MYCIAFSIDYEGVAFIHTSSLMLWLDVVPSARYNMIPEEKLPVISDISV
jgi:hypothetical protein